MKDYYNLFVQLSLQLCFENDYSDKSKVKKHNKASAELGRLRDEMINFVGEETWRKLLNHSDDRVKINAVSACLKYGVLVDESFLVLKNIINNSDDSTIRFSARMLLQKYK